MLRKYASPLLLLLVAALWGGGFVAQKSGMEGLGPYSFNVARFILATVSLIPVWFWLRRRSGQQGEVIALARNQQRYFWLGGVVAGTVLTGGLTFQQVGLQFTTAGNAGFITSMYLVIVPVLGLLVGQRVRLLTWAGIALALVGLYTLSVKPGDQVFSMGYGDSLQLIGAFFWALHVIVLGWLSRRVVDLVGLSAVQFAVAALWSLMFAVFTETPVWQDFLGQWRPLLYSGVISSGVAFTLQIIGQRNVASEVAALILSMEAVFGLVLGVLMLGEQFTLVELAGCALMLAGIVFTLLPDKASVDVSKLP